MTRIRPNFLSDARVQHVFDLLGPLGGGYVVGGAVRDSLLGLNPKDVDFATPAEPDVVMRTLREAGHTPIPLGIEYGVVAVSIQGETFEITTFRHDVVTDGRRAVTRWGSSLEDDAVRRDLTINALYMDREGDVIDVVGGLEDIEARRIRFVGDADTRIREDRLRALRMFRFWARFGDPDPSVHAEAIAAASKFAGDMSVLSRERVGHEVVGILSAVAARTPVRTMIEVGLWEDVLPGTDADRLMDAIEDDGTAPSHARVLARIAAAGADPKTALKLTSKAAKFVDLVKASMHQEDAAVTAWRHGEGVATEATFLRRAFGLPVPDDVEDRIRRGANAKFPLAAADLPHLKGKELGDALREAQQNWVLSDMRADAAELLRIREQNAFGSGPAM